MISSKEQSQKISRAMKEYFAKGDFSEPVLISCDFIGHSITGEKCRQCFETVGKCNETGE